MNHRWDTSGKDLRRVRVDKRTCPECHGDGVVHIEEQYIAVFCPHCKGKGYIGEEIVGETISYSSGEVPEDNAWLFEEGMAWQKQRIKELEAEVERLRQGCEIWKQQSNINFQGLCGRDRQIANQELEIQRLRQQLKICTKALDKACRGDLKAGWARGGP